MPPGLSRIIVHVLVGRARASDRITGQVFGCQAVLGGDRGIAVDAIGKGASNWAGMREEVQVQHLLAIGSGHLREVGIHLERMQATVGALEVHENKLLLYGRQLPVVGRQLQRVEIFALASIVDRCNSVLFTARPEIVR